MSMNIRLENPKHKFIRDIANIEGLLTYKFGTRITPRKILLISIDAEEEQPFHMED